MPNKHIISRAIALLVIIVFALLGSHFLHSSKADSIVGDLNNDGTVNIFDLSILLGHWQQSGTNITGDLNSDGIVNLFDLSILLGHWGETSSTGNGPTNTALPTISGYTTAPTTLNYGAGWTDTYDLPGSEVVTTPGSWLGSPTSDTYQWQDCDSSGNNCANVSETGQGGSLNNGNCSSTTFCYIVQTSDLNKTLKAVVTATNGGGSTTATSAYIGPVIAYPLKGVVNCGLTHAAGADGTNSCWATHTGSTSFATGCSEAQIEAGSPAQCASPYWRHVTGDQTISTANTIIDHVWISGCVAIKANNVTIRDVLITPNGDVCSGGPGGSQASAVNNGNSASAPSGTIMEDVTMDVLNGTPTPPYEYVDSIEGGSGEAQCIRCSAFGGTDNFAPVAGGVLYIDNYSSTVSPNPNGAHQQNWAVDSSAHVAVEHSYAIFQNSQSGSGAFFFESDYGPVSYIFADNNYAEGDSASLDMSEGCGQPYAVFTNNALANNGSAGYANGYISGGTGNAWSGNYGVDVNGNNLGAVSVPGKGSC